MFNFLHTFHPTPILISLGPANVYWYGLFLVLGMLAGILAVLKIADYYNVSKDMLIDLIFWLIIGGIVGARIYDIFLEMNYYKGHLWDVLKIWQGGLAIHGAIIAVICILYFYTKREKLNFWLISSILVPGAALGQAIGRWGNYFNQEIFGKPTNLPWGIPIDPINRPGQYFLNNYFHPAFLYESIGNVIIFGILIFMHYRNIKNKKENYKFITFSYLIMYSILRFIMEFVRVDNTPVFLGLRFPQIISIIIILGAIFFLKFSKVKRAKDETQNPALEK